MAWINERHHLLSWVLSVETARRHYPHTSLFTDDKGAEMLIDAVGLQFEHVSTELNVLDRHDPDWWALGKVYTYSLQSEPFVHIDSDVFLWNPLPARLESAAVFTQNPEYISYGSSYYRSENFEFAINAVNGWMPEELDSYFPFGGVLKACCCGILGGNRIDFIKYYANLAIKLLEDPRNQPAWILLADKIGDNVIFEQYLLSACIKYHKGREGSPYKDIDIQYLFESAGEACTNAEKAGYTHMVSIIKKNRALMESLEKRVQRDYPEYYKRCIRVVAN